MNFTDLSLKMSKKKKKILKIVLLILLITPVAIVGLATLIASSAFVQTHITKFASDYLSDKYKTEINVSRVFINPFSRKVDLKGVFIRDLNDDTLLYAGKINSQFKWFNLTKFGLIFSDLNIDSVTANLIVDSVGNFNFDFLIPNDTTAVDTLETDSEPFNFVIDVKKVNLTNINFKYSTKNDSIIPTAMDFDNIILKNVNLIAHDFSINQDLEIYTKIDSLKAWEHCGFQIDKLAAETFVSTYNIKLYDLQLITPSTNFAADSLKFLYDSFDTFSYFCDSVKIEANVVENSTLALQDLAAFVPDIYGYNIVPKISGNVNGEVNNLKIKNLNLAYGKDTHLFADAEVKGLPDIDNTFFNINIKDLSASQTDLTSIHKANDTTKLIDLPDALKDLGIINYNAKIKGSINNLTVDGKLNSNLGTIETAVKVLTDSVSTSIEGVISAGDLDIGSVAGDKQNFGKLFTNDTVNIKIYNSGNVSGTAKGRIDSLGLLGYTYSNVALNGKFTDKFFDGKISINDNNLKLLFNGLVNFGGKVPRYNFELNVDHADLKKMNILSDTIDNVKFGLTADIEGTSLDDLNGMIFLTEKLTFEQNSKTLELNQLTLNAFIDHYICNLPLKKIIIHSDYLDAQMQGLFETKQLTGILSNFIYMVFPSLNYEGENNIKRPRRPPQTKKISFNDPDFQRLLGNNFKFSADLKNTDKITDFFVPELRLSNNTSASGGFDTRKHHIWVDLKTDSIVYNGIKIDSLNVNAHALERDLYFGLRSDSVALSDSFKIKQPMFFIKARRDSATYAMRWQNEEKKNEGEISGDIILKKHYIDKHFPLITGTINKGEFFLMDSQWNIKETSFVVDSNSVEISNFGLKSESQSINVDGTIADEPSKKLIADIQELDLSMVSKILAGFNIVEGLDIKGIMSGKTSVCNIYGDIPVFETANKISDLNVNGVSLGDFFANCNFTPVDSIINLDFYTKRRLADKNNAEKDTLKPLHGYGICNIEHKTIDFSFDVNYLPLNTFKPYFQDYLETSKYSILSGYARLKGKIDDPKIMAAMSLHGGYFKINYLGTQYDINDSLGITLDNNKIKLSRTKLYSDRGTGSATLEGEISHKNFDNININLNLKCNNFMFLNAKESDTAAFYGKAYASGDINLTGNPSRRINIDARVKTEKNTVVYLPMYGASDASTDFEFITFKTNDTLSFAETRRKANIMGLKMNFNLEVTPDAEVQIILDPTTGDIMKASASGNLRLDISGNGDFNMYGTLQVEKGEYMFTMQNIFSKKFEVQKGGTLRWNGAPTEAIVNISAVYKLRKVNLFNLMPTEESYRDKKIPVQCLLNMRENIMQPEISFGIKLDDSDDRVQTQIDNLDEGNLNKQVVSLLLLNQFQPLPGLRSSNQTGMFNAGELLSNQLNHWLSDISDNFDVGVNYQMGDETTSSEFEVAVSTQLFDDRVSISTNVGVGGENRNNTATSKSNSVVGEVEVNVNLNKSGSIKLKAYNKANDDDFDQAPYTQGVGISFRKEFDKIRDLFARKRKKKIKYYEMDEFKN